MRNSFRIHPLSNNYPPLHGVRVLAILLVIQLHISYCLLKFPFYSEQRGFFTWVSLSCWYGMDMFFVLSGFLIGSVFLHSQFSVLRFYWRRAFRIFPLYYFVLIGLIVLEGLTDYQKQNLWKELIYLSNYPFTEKNLMYWSWSLSVEEHFYLVVPVLVLFLLRLKSTPRILFTLGLIWLSGLFVRAVVFWKNQPIYNDMALFQSIYTPTHCRYDLLTAGLFLAFVQKHKSEELKRLLGKPWVNFVFWSVPLLAILFLSYPPKPFFSIYQWMVLDLGTTTGFAYGLLILWLLNSKNRFVDLLSHRYFLILATLGYGTYLIHIPILEKLAIPLVLRYTHSVITVWWSTYALTLILSFIAAYFLHITVEKYFLRLREKL